MFKKILVIMITILININLCSCEIKITQPPTYRKNNYDTITFYNNDNNIIGQGVTDNISYLSYECDLNNIELLPLENGSFTYNLLDLFNLEYKFNCEINNTFPSQYDEKIFENDYLEYCKNDWFFQATYSYEYVDLNEYENFEESFLLKEFSKYENKKDMWEEYRLKHYITRMDVDNYLNYITIIEDTNGKIGFSYKSCIWLDNSNYFSLYDAKVNQTDYEHNILENDNSKCLIVNATHILNEKHLYMNDKSFETFVLSVLSYNTIIPIPYKVLTKTNEIGLMIYNYKSIKILKNDITLS